MFLNPYLQFNGDCEEAFQFYAECLGGSIEAMLLFEGSPAEDYVPAEWRKKVLHAELRIGDRKIMGADPPPGRYQKPQGMSVTLGVDSVGEAERIFEALSEKGSIEMPLGETFFAERFGVVIDRFGTPWMIVREKASA